MSESEKFSKPLPVNENVVVKLPISTQIRTVNNTLVFNATESPLYSSTKEVDDKIVKPIRQHIRPEEIFKLGIKAEILEPEKKWVAGNLRLSFVWEFIPDIIPDEPDVTNASTTNMSGKNFQEVCELVNKIG